MAENQKKKIMAQFKKLDQNGDGQLDFDELKVLLKRGNPTFKDEEVKKLYDSCDVNHDGKVSFEEFVDYVFGADAHHAQDRAPGGRHGAAAAAAGPKQDDSETSELWAQCHETFKNYGDGKMVDQTKFAKMVKDTKLIGHGFKQPDIDMIFMKVVTKGQRKLTWDQFQDALRLIAAKRNQANADVMAIVAGGSGGPVLKGTKADHVAFYDDKSKFTGSAAHNDNFDGVDHGTTAQGREARIHEREERELHASDSAELPWDSVKAKFDDYAGKDAVLDGREFKKFLEQTPGIFTGGMQKTDVDICFAKAAKGAKKLDFAMFQDAIRAIAGKQGKGLGHVQQLIENNAGQTMSGTKADAVRFHDDKSTYTGAHGDVHGRTDDRGAGRHEAATAGAAGIWSPGEDEGDWTKADDCFMKFGGSDGLDGRETLKFCKQTGLIDKNKFNPQMMDVLFATVCKGGKKLLGLDAYHAFVRGVAGKKGATVGEIQDIIGACDGPTMNATEADYVSFHDDPSTYTGSHVGK